MAWVRRDRDNLGLEFISGKWSVFVLFQLNLHDIPVTCGYWAHCHSLTFWHGYSNAILSDFSVRLWLSKPKRNIKLLSMFFCQFDKIFPEMFLSIHWLTDSSAFISSGTVSHGIRAVAGPCPCLISSEQSSWVTGLCPYITVAELPRDALLWTWGAYGIPYSLFLNINLLLASVSL